MDSSPQEHRDPWSSDMSGYKYADASTNHSHGYLLPYLLSLLDELAPTPASRRVFELGCGNGAIANVLATRGFAAVTGVDPSIEGIVQAQVACPALTLEVGSAYDDLRSHYGTFPIVLRYPLKNSR